MTRDKVLARYHPVRAGIQRILRAAVRTCSSADVKRAAKQLGVWSSGRIEVPNETAIDMVADLALFERTSAAFEPTTAFFLTAGILLIQPTLLWPIEWQARAFRSSASFDVMTLQACG
jgi:hypothetical protein